MSTVFRALGVRRKSCQSPASSQRGAVLIVGMIVLVLLTVIVVGSFSLTRSNQQVIFNQQMRDDAVTAAQVAVERVIGSVQSVDIRTLTTYQQAVDLNGDNVDDYTVTVQVPDCVRRRQASGGQPSDVELGAEMQTPGFWFTDWEFRSVVVDNRTGARATVVQGIRLFQTENEMKASGCTV
jgi:hypothetical protein